MLKPQSNLQVHFYEIILYFSTSIGIDASEQGVVGGGVTMACPIQTPNDTKVGEWSWCRYDNVITDKVAVMEVNKSVTGPGVTSPNKPIVTTSLDGALTL